MVSKLIHFLFYVAGLVTTVLSYSCDKAEFYQPYAHVKKTKNGPSLTSLRSSGFIDLRLRNRILLCINGPAILYYDVEKLDSTDNASTKKPTNVSGTPTSRPSQEQLRFTNGELSVYVHSCMSINRVAFHVLKRLKEEQGRIMPELSSDLPAQGKIILGIYLIGEAQSYLNPTLVWFKGSNLDYIKSRDLTVKGSSFALVTGKTKFCGHISDGTQFVISTPLRANDDARICKWLPPANYDEALYSKYFQRGFDSSGTKTGDEVLKEGDYRFSHCPDEDGDRQIIWSSGRTTPAPVSSNFSEFDPFSLFDPNVVTFHGFRKDTGGLSGGDERKVDKTLRVELRKDTCVEPSCEDSGNSQEDDKEDIPEMQLEDMQNVDPRVQYSFEVVAEECLDLPVYNPDLCTCPGTEGRRLLELALDLDPLFTRNETNELNSMNDSIPTRKDTYNITPNLITEEQKKSLPKWGNLDSSPHLKWKHDVLYTVASVFENLCMPFRREFPYSVARVFGWYVLKAHSYGDKMGRNENTCNSTRDPGQPKPETTFDHLIEQPDHWVWLHKELKRCKDLAKQENHGFGLKFQWETGEELSFYKIPVVGGSSPRRKRKVRSFDYPVKRKKRSIHKNSYSPPNSSSILRGKPLQTIRSEGNVGYVRETIQEYMINRNSNDPRNDQAKYCDHPRKLKHCWFPQLDRDTNTLVCARTADIFFFEDKAEVDFELNIAIDLWWKIWATTLGYCNKAYKSRQSETFPRMYNGMSEHFFELVIKEWKYPQDNEDLKFIFSEYITEYGHTWLDACMEGAYLSSESQSMRPPRPLTVKGDQGEDVANYFEELPSSLYFRHHKVSQSEKDA